MSKNRCKYCGQITYGTPYCKSCSKKYFNYNSKFKWNYPSKLKPESVDDEDINYFKNSPYSKSCDPLRETTSERANRIDKLFRGYQELKEDRVRKRKGESEQKRKDYRDSNLSSRLKHDKRLEGLLRTDEDFYRDHIYSRTKFDWE